jgi:hypothetical protein
LAFEKEMMNLTSLNDEEFEDDGDEENRYFSMIKEQR